MSDGYFSFLFEKSDIALEFVEDEHIYLANGVIVPSVTQIMQASFPDKYAGIAYSRLQAAAERGTAIHRVVEGYVNYGVSTPLTDELRGYRFLERTYGFKSVTAEMPLIYCQRGKPVFAGRMDLLLDDGGTTLADIKTTAILDKEWLKVQLNLYLLAFEQCYGEKVTGLKGIHLRGQTRKYVNIPIDTQCAKDALKKYKDTLKKAKEVTQ